MGELWDHSDLVFTLVSDPLSFKMRWWLRLRFFRNFLEIKPGLALFVEGHLPEEPMALVGVELLKYAQSPGITWTESLEGERLWVFAPGLRPFTRLGQGTLAETQKFYPNLPSYYISPQILQKKQKILGGTWTSWIRRWITVLSLLFLTIGLGLTFWPFPKNTSLPALPTSLPILLDMEGLTSPVPFPRPACLETLDLDSLHINATEWEIRGEPITTEDVLRCLAQHPSVEVLEAPLGYGLKQSDHFMLRGKNQSFSNEYGTALLKP